MANDQLTGEQIARVKGNICYHKAAAEIDGQSARETRYHKAAAEILQETLDFGATIATLEKQQAEK